MSGRTLRRLPVLAHSRYLSYGAKMSNSPLNLLQWIEAIHKIVEDSKDEMSKIVGGQSVEL